MEQFLIVSAIVGWIVTLFTFLLNLTLVRRVNQANKGVSQDASAMHPGDEVILQTEFLEVGTLAPTFTAHTLDGTVVRIEEYRGRIAIFTFVTNYLPSQNFLLNLDKTVLSRLDKENSVFTLVGINSLEDTHGLLEQTNTSLPILVAPRKSNSFSIDYLVGSTPLIYVLDRNGRVKWGGNVSAENINELLEVWLS